jgi:small ligand-binding sensory domain FIST
MKKAYADSLKQSAMKVTVASVVTVFVDRRVASHARGVLAIVVEKKDTGAVIACSEAGIITNGQGKKIWWIPSDGYKLISSAAEITALSPYLLQVQQEINEGTFDQKTQAKVKLISTVLEQAVHARNHAAAVLVAGAVQGVVASVQRRGAAAPATAVEIVTIL